jgi:non-specific serine/threonine protein kinase/serine/threonine-protein kinase
MQPDRWQRVKEIFAGALDRPAVERPGFVRQACRADSELHAEVISLLQAHDESGAFIEQPAIERIGLARAEFVIDWQGKRLGSYRIVSELGRGGMSHVYKAVRDDDQYYKEVAIKLLRPGLDSHSLLERLRAERQMLAELSHPNIAQLLDGGVTESGAPYIVMEYIEGQPIDVYCEERSLGIKQRLELMRTLCAAVHYVHQHLMVHGDLKTNNILVTDDGVIKLLDFGIARLLKGNTAAENHETVATRVIALTPAYASPEQVRGESITTASDVYSLGVLLYRMLAGTLPFAVLPELFGWEAAASFAEQDPRLPSEAAAAGNSAYRRLARELRGDLDAIVMKALSKNPDDRYGSAEHFAEDLRRYLRRRPVHARPDKPLYRIGKLVQRHKAATVSTSLFALALVGGIVTTSWQAHIARGERARAERHLTEIRKLTNTYLRDVYDAAVDLPGATAIRKLLVENSLKHIAALEGEAQDSLQFQRELAWAYQKFGDVQGDYLGANLGDTEGAVQSYRHALRLRQAVAGRSNTMQDLAELLRSHIALSELLYAQSKLPESLEHAEAAIAIGERLLAMPGATNVERRDAAAALMVFGTNVSAVDSERSLQSLRRALPIFERIFSEDSSSVSARSDMGLAHGRIAFTYMRAAQPEKAVEQYLKASEYVEGLIREYPLDAAVLRFGAFVHVNLGEAYNRTGRTDAALKALHVALERVEHLQQSDPANEQAPLAVAYVLNHLSDSYLLENEPPTALTHLHRAAALIAKAPPAKPTDIAEVRLLAGANAFRLGRVYSMLASSTGKHRYDAITQLQRSIASLQPLTTDPVIGKDAQQLVQQAEQLLQSLA